MSYPEYALFTEGAALNNLDQVFTDYEDALNNVQTEAVPPRTLTYKHIATDEGLVQSFGQPLTLAYDYTGSPQAGTYTEGDSPNPQSDTSGLGWTPIIIPGTGTTAKIDFLGGAAIPTVGGLDSPDPANPIQAILVRGNVEVGSISNVFGVLVGIQHNVGGVWIDDPQSYRMVYRDKQQAGEWAFYDVPVVAVYRTNVATGPYQGARLVCSALTPLGSGDSFTLLRWRISALPLRVGVTEL